MFLGVTDFNQRHYHGEFTGSFYKLLSRYLTSTSLASFVFSQIIFSFYSSWGAFGLAYAGFS